MRILKSYSKENIDQMLYTYPLAQLAATAKVHDFDGASFWTAQENVFGLQIAVYNTKFGSGEEHQRRAHLMSKFASQVEGYTAEISVAQKIVKVVGEQLED